MKKIIIIFALSIFLIGCAKKEIKNYILSTGGSGGSYYSFGMAVAGVFNSTFKDSSIIVENSSGSIDNLKKINDNKADLALAQNDIIYYAYNGIDEFSSNTFTNFSAVLTLYPEVIQIVASKSSKITNISSMKGKRVSIGELYSGTEINARQILEVYDLSLDDIKKTNLSFKDATDRLQKGLLDACFIVGGIPNASLQELSLSTDIVLLNIDNDEIKERYNYYSDIIIPANIYRGVTNDIRSLAIKATMVANNNLSEKAVYDVIKTLFEKKEDLIKVNSKYEELDIEGAFNGIFIPFHSGALKYYRELGYKLGE